MRGAATGIGRFAAILGIALLSGCDVFMEVRGRSYGTDDARLAGISVVEDEAAVDAFEDAHPGIWWLGGVESNREKSDALGRWATFVQCSHVFLYPIGTGLRFEKDGYRPDSIRIWVSEIKRKRVIAVLLRDRRAAGIAVGG
jgi:hypothetical protein